MSSLPILFEDFTPGAMMGESVFAYTEEQAHRWQAIFGAVGGKAANRASEGASMAVIAMMRSYLDVVCPRPPGNVHAKQYLKMHDVPRMGEGIHVAVQCVRKELRRDRRYVELRVTGTAQTERALFEGLLTLIWAA